MKIFTSVLLSFLYISAFSQFSISGIVKNSQGEKLTSASVFLKDTKHATTTNEKGEFTLDKIPVGEYTLKVTYIGYGGYVRSLSLSQNLALDIELSGVIYGIDEIQIKSTWVNKEQPFAYSTIEKEDIEVANLGQDVPFVLKWTPSTVVTSDAGAGIGYTGIRVRGSDPTRINVTINGIPLNDAESQNVFWVDLPDFLSSVDQVQIQRGVGTSTNGAAAFGASINLNTQQTRINPYITLNSSIGSYNTLKYAAQAGTGLMNGKYTIDARLSKITSDGYIDRASANLSSFYFSASRITEKSSLKLVAFHGSEVTYQAWNGLPIQFIDSDRQYNPSGTEKPGEPYENEVDDYDQTHIQLLYDRSLGSDWLMNAGLHYTKGSGFFEQYKAGQNLLDYSLSDDLGETDLVRRRWLDNDFFGGIVSVQKTSDRYTMTVGGAYNIYQGAHFGKVVWTENNTLIPEDHRYYDNDATKKDANVYAKFDYTVVPTLRAFIDMQLRRVDYEFLGFDADFNNVSQTDDLTFFNPKLGFSYFPSQSTKLFASMAVGNREPNRNDYTESSPNIRPEHETLYDLELGFEYSADNIGLGINLYNMKYNNQLVNTGLLNDVGAVTRENVDDSFRRGIEVYSKWQATNWLNWSAGFTLSRNKIENYTLFIDDWDTGGQISEPLGETDLSFSPSVIANTQFDVALGPFLNKKIFDDLSVSIMTKYVGKQFIDNSSLPGSELKAYSYTDFRIVWPISTELTQELALTFQLNNVFNALYSANAWLYRFQSTGYDPVPDDPYAVSEGNGQYNLTGLFPQAERNFLVGVRITL